MSARISEATCAAGTPAASRALGGREVCDMVRMLRRMCVHVCVCG